MGTGLPEGYENPEQWKRRREAMEAEERGREKLKRQSEIADYIIGTAMGLIAAVGICALAREETKFMQRQAVEERAKRIKQKATSAPLHRPNAPTTPVPHVNGTFRAVPLPQIATRDTHP